MIMLGATHYFPVIIGFEMPDHTLCNHSHFIKGEESTVRVIYVSHDHANVGSVSFIARSTSK
jgi:hypothetical protein